MWKILVIIAVILLVISFFRRRNAIWGGATIGLITGLIVAIFQKFNWSIVWKVFTIGVLIGAVADLLGLFSEFLKKRFNI